MGWWDGIGWKDGESVGGWGVWEDGECGRMGREWKDGESERWGEWRNKGRMGRGRDNHNMNSTQGGTQVCV